MDDEESKEIGVNAEKDTAVPMSNIALSNIALSV